MRKGTKARIERQKRALARLNIIRAQDWAAACKPLTNIKRFANEDQYAAYFARKITEKSALQVRTRHTAA